jgi:RNA polymerase sigma-70 factor (ECF subfamily)
MTSNQPRRSAVHGEVLVCYKQTVLSLNPALLQLAVSDSPDLLAQARRGDAESFCALCRGHETRLLRQALLLCGDVALAEDLAQETLFRAWKSIQRYNERCQFFTWLCAILLNCYRTLRKKKHPIAFSALHDFESQSAQQVLENIADANLSPAQLTEQAEATVLVRRCLESLPAKQREVVYLRFYVNASLGETPPLGCSTGTEVTPTMASKNCGDEDDEPGRRGS